jgi:hypothetical protein
VIIVEAYVVRVQIMGEELIEIVGTREKAEELLKTIKQKGYRHYEGNAVREIPANKVIRVTYTKVIF